MRYVLPPPRHPPDHRPGPRVDPRPYLAEARLPTAQELAPAVAPFAGMCRCRRPACTRPWVPRYYFLARYDACLDCAIAAGFVTPPKLGPPVALFDEPAASAGRPG